MANHEGNYLTWPSSLLCRYTFNSFYSIAFLEFTTEDASSRAKNALEQMEFGGKLPVVTFTSAQNPFKHVPKGTVIRTTERHTLFIN